MKKSLIVCAFLGSAAAAYAQGPSTSTVSREGPSNDPDEIVCRYENTIGSRVNRTRVCRTRAEWAETKAQTRQIVDRVQSGRQTSGQ